MHCCCFWTELHKVSIFPPTMLQVAEATVLHNEVQLQEALEGRMSAEEQASGCICEDR